MDLYINPAQRLHAFVRQSMQGNPDESARTVLMRVLEVENGDIATMFRRFAIILEVARQCVDFAETLHLQDTRIGEESVQGARQLANALERVQLDTAWRHCLGAMGSAPLLAVSWLAPLYPAGLETPEQVRSWREDLLQALAEANKALETVPSSEREANWLRVYRAVNRIVEYLNAIEVEGVEAAERAWVHALALDRSTKDAGTNQRWWQQVVPHLEMIGKVASAMNCLFQVIPLFGTSSALPSLPSVLPPPMLGPGAANDRA
jgi:hypothetical protein